MFTKDSGEQRKNGGADAMLKVRYKTRLHVLKGKKRGKKTESQIQRAMLRQNEKTNKKEEGRKQKVKCKVKYSNLTIRL